MAWADNTTVWAYINPLSGHELANLRPHSPSHAPDHRALAIGVLRPAGNGKMRIVYAGRRFAIGSAVDIDMAPVPSDFGAGRAGDG